MRQVADLKVGSYVLSLHQRNPYVAADLQKVRDTADLKVGSYVPSPSTVATST